MRPPPPSLTDAPIAGAATPPGASGVAVIRLSGVGLDARLAPLLRRPGGGAVSLAELPPRVMTRLDIVDLDPADLDSVDQDPARRDAAGAGPREAPGDGGARPPGAAPPESAAAPPVLDQLLVVRFPAPRSFTGEDMVELHGHGSPVVVGRILALLAARGVRPAQPGEFSRRAFLNGKMDLTAAEALMGLIEAASLRAARAAARQLRGDLARDLGAARERMATTLAHLEAHLDFPEEEIAPAAVAELTGLVDACRADLAPYREGARLGGYLSRGFDLAVVGRPNVGKSSLFNRLAGDARAIVTDIPGTTRDLNENETLIDGAPVRLVDTAGLRDGADPVEREGIRRAWERLQAADGVLFVAEAHRGWLAEDQALLDRIDRADVVIVYNKGDLCPAEDLSGLNGPGAEGPGPERPEGSDPPVLVTSCRDGRGVDRLKTRIAALIGGADADGEGRVILAARQAEALGRAEAGLGECAALLGQGRDLELAALALRDALAALGEVTGEVTHDQILDRIFSTFCIGK